MIHLNVKQIAVLSCVIWGCAGQAMAVTQPSERKPDLFERSIEELQQVKIKVSSVSKHEEDLFEAPAAIYVITADDIRRTGLTSLPDLLRLAPGMVAGQITSQKWRVSARGFAITYANKMLVLVDGRTIYSPFFGGVFWEAQDYPLEDIERIEIIRGPGATLWGANAVNGVINIISKKAKDTQGALLTGIGGTYDRAMGLVRHGGKIGEKAYYRVYGKYFKRDDLVSREGNNLGDDWAIKSAGFQVDGKIKNSNWMVQSKKYRGGGDTLETPGSQKNIFSGQHILGNWAHAITPGSDVDFKIYYDQTWRNENPRYSENRYLWDFEAQHHYKLFPRQDIVWGAGYRATSGKIGLGTSTTAVDSITAVDPNKRIERTYNVFIQDEIAVRNDFRFTIGSKVEKNVYTGVEIQPSARFTWLPNAKHSVWGAISRAVHVPTRNDRDITTLAAILTVGDLGIIGLPPSFPVQVPLLPNKSMKSERLTAYELGYRVRPIETLFFDLAAFYNAYRGLYGLQQAGAVGFNSTFTSLIYPVQPANGVNAKSFGLEWLAEWLALPNWKLKAAYTFLTIQAKSKNPADFIYAPFWEVSGPKNQLQVHSDWDLPHQVKLGVGLYYMDLLKTSPLLITRKMAPYYRADVRLSWQPIQKLLVELVGQHLLDSHYMQATTTGGVGSVGGEVERGAYLKLRLDV